ncbi:MAG: TIGR02099 family protein [Gammaproteobacteria bacterium]|nr:TIGR02099 family protein [Gammaproteobacteria bacterium]
MHRHIIRWSLILSITGTIALAILIAIARVLLPGIEHYRGEFETALGQSLKRPVSIGALHFDWQGWAPTLRADTISILDPEEGDADFRIATAFIRIAPWDSLLSGALQPARVSISGVQLPVRRHVDGHFSIAGIDLVETDSGSGFGFLSPREISLTNSEVWWRDDLLRADQPPLHFRDARLLVGHDNTHWNAQLDARFEDGHIDLRIDGDGAFLTGNAQARAYARVQALSLPPLSHLGVGELRGLVNAEVWAQLNGAGLESLRGHFDAAQIESEKLPALKGLAGEFQAQRSQDGWKGEIENLLLDSDEPPRVALSASLAWHQRDDGDWLALGLDRLHLPRWHALLKHSPLLPAAIAEAIEKLAPQGTVSALTAALDLSDATAPAFQIEAQLQDLGISAWSGIPGLTGLSGTLRADAGGATLDIDSHKVEARFPGLFRDPLLASRLQGLLTARHSPDGWSLRADRIEMDNADIATASQFEIDIAPDGDTTLRLVSDFRDGDASTVPTYLPAGIMPTSAVAWLDRGIVSGRVLNGGVLFNGRLADFPFDDHSGRFEVRFNATNVVVDYREGWPRIEEIEAETRFVNKRLEIHSVGGKIFSVDLPKVSAIVPDLLNSELFINGTARGAGAEMMRFLMDSPLHDDFGVYFKGMELGGDTELDLSIYLPLDTDAGMKVKGDLSFSDNSLKVADLGNEFGAMNGHLTFTGQGLFAKGVTATLNRRPVTVNVETDPKGEVTEVELLTNANLSELLGAVAKPIAAQFPGRADWRTTLGFHRLQSGDSQPDTEITVRSDLRGIAIDAPPPFGKTAQAARTLQVSSLVGVDEPAPVRVRYGDDIELLVDMRLGASGPEPRAAELRLGGEPAQTPTLDGLQVRGTLPELDLEALLGGTSGNPDALPKGLAPRDIALTIAALKVAGQTFHDADLHATRSPDGWHVRIDSREAKGEILVPQALIANGENPAVRHNAIQVQLERLHLATAADTGTSPREPGAQGDPRTLPDLRVSIRELHIDDMNLGRIDVDATAVPSGLEFTRIRLDNGSTQGEGKGAWKADKQGQISNISLTLTSDELSQTLRDFGFIDVIDGGHGKVTLRGGWVGTPGDFSLRTFDGNLNVRFSEGRLLEVDPGAGGRVFGLFSLTALPRRLRLDFSDLFKKGFSFDVIEGSFSILDGDAHTADLSLRGPPAQVDIAGRTGFADHVYDQTVTVTPHIGTTVAAASALLNPVVGAALLVANKLLKNPLDKASQFQYEMRGPWDNPVIERLDKNDAKDETDGAAENSASQGNGFLE